MQNQKLMLRAIELAKTAMNKTSPNPKVGCVIVKGGKIIAEGYHKGYGKAHAEVEALRKAKGNAKGADLYVSLEPCCHYGKTGPCTKAIIKAGIRKVFVAVKDPNPKVNGRGIAELKKSGIKVEVGMCKKEAEALNAPFFKGIKKKMPFVIAKIAMSKDGKITYGNGKRKIISGKESHAFSYYFRNYVDAILVGANTVGKDDPRLLPKPLLGKKPLRIVLDPWLGIKSNAKMLGEEAVIFYSKKKKGKLKKEIKILGKKARLFAVSEKNGKLNLKEVLRMLNGLGVNLLLVEGGAEVFSSFVNGGFADSIMVFVSPKKVGEGKTVLDRLKRRIKIISASKLGKDILVDAV